MDRDKQDSTERAYSSRPQPRFVRDRPRSVRILPSFGVAATVFWAPLVMVISLGITTWLDAKPWFTLLLVAPGVLVAAISQWLPPNAGRLFMAIVSGAGAVVSVVALGALLGNEHWIGSPVYFVFLGTASTLLGVLFGLWLVRKQGACRR